MPLLIHTERQRDTALTTCVSIWPHALGNRVLRQQTAIMKRISQLEAMRNYDLPVMVLCGREDALTPLKLHEEMADSIPDARLCIIEECGHLSTLERPHAVTALLRDWLLRN